MKRFLLFLATSALVLSIVGCSKDSTPEVPTPPETPTVTSTQLLLKGEIAALKQGSRVNANGFENEDAVRVYVSENENFDLYSQVSAMYNDGDIVLPKGREIYWENADTRLHVRATYPTNISDKSFVGCEDQSVSENFYNSDLLYATASNLAPQTTPVQLTFQHLMSRINVSFIADEGITQDELDVATKQLGIEDVLLGGQVDFVTGTVTNGSFNHMTVKPLAVGASAYSAIVWPQSGNITFRLDIDGDVYTYSTDVDFQSGYQYNYKLKISVDNSQQMALQAVDIEEWKDGATVEDGMNEKELSDDIITGLDPIFRAYLLGEVHYEAKEGAISIPDPGIGSFSRFRSWYYDKTDNKIDADGDGEISKAEAANVLCLEIPKGVAHFVGLEYFPNLEGLEVESTVFQGSSIDLSKYTKLRAVSLDLPISSLDITKNKDLEYVFLLHAQLQSIDLTNNTKLVSFSCNSSSLETLDLSKNTALTRLECRQTPLANLDVSKNTALTYLCCTYNKLTALDVSKNTALTYLRCNLNELTALDVSNNTSLNRLYCEFNQLTNLDLSKNTVLRHLACMANKLTTLDVSKNTTLEEIQCNPMDDENGNNLLTTIYMANGQTLEYLAKPDATVIEYK